MKDQKWFVFVGILIVALLAFMPINASAASLRPAPTATDVLTVAITVALGFASLVGTAALIAAIINILKTFHVVTDGTANYWSVGLNLAAFIALVVFRVYRPQLTLDILDGYAGQIATVILFIFGFIVQLTTSATTHFQLSNARVPVIGKSFSRDHA